MAAIPAGWRDPAFTVRPAMSFLRLYVRFLALLAPVKGLAGALVVANLALAKAQFMDREREPAAP